MVGVVVDVGSGCPMSKMPDSLKALVMNARLYCAIDYCVDYSPHVIADAYRLPVADCMADIVILKAVIEHVTNPQDVIGEAYRILKNGGALHLYCPFVAGYHGNKDYGDYWRFTEQGLRWLLRDFSLVIVRPTSGLFTAFAKMTRYKFLKSLAKMTDRMVKTGVTSGWYAVAVK